MALSGGEATVAIKVFELAQRQGWLDKLLLARERASRCFSNL
jgi:hypothetical protein